MWYGGILWMPGVFVHLSCSRVWWVGEWVGWGCHTCGGVGGLGMPCMEGCVFLSEATCCGIREKREVRGMVVHPSGSMV